MSAIPDLSNERQSGDMSIPADLSPPWTFDLAWTACAGSSLANTCVEKFFEPFVACFMPAGSCGFGGLGTEHATWSNGAVYFQRWWPTIGKSEWVMGFTGQKTCLLFYPPGNDSDQSQMSDGLYCQGDDSTCAPGADQGTMAHGLRYDAASSTFTCSDGTQVKYDRAKSCGVLDALLSPAGLCR